MVAVALDTLKINNRLKAKGFSEEQAIALTETVQEVATAAASSAQESDAALATKADLKMEVGALRSEIGALRSEMREMELRIIIKMGIMLGAAVGFIAALVKLL